MSNYGYGFSGSSGSLGSSSIKPLMGAGAAASSLGLGSSSLRGAGASSVSSTQLQDAAFAARVLGLSDNFSSSLIGSSLSSTGGGGGGGGVSRGVSSYGGTGLLGSSPQPISSLSRDVPAATSYSDYGGLGTQQRTSGYSDNFRDGGSYLDSSSDQRSRGDEQRSYTSPSYGETNSRPDSRSDFTYGRDERSSTMQSSDIYDTVYSSNRQSGSGNDNRDFSRRNSGGGGGGRNRQQRRQAQNNRNQQQQQQQQQQRQQQQRQQEQEQRSQQQTQDVAQLQAQLQTQVQLQETLKRLQNLEEDQRKKDLKMEQMESMLRKRKMEDELQSRAAIKQPRIERLAPSMSLLSSPSQGPRLDMGSGFNNFGGSGRYPTEPLPMRSQQGPMRSQQGPMRSPQVPMRSPQGSMRSPRGPMRSPRGPMRSPQGPIQPLMPGLTGRSDLGKRPFGGSSPGRGGRGGSGGRGGRGGTPQDRTRERKGRRRMSASGQKDQQQRGPKQQNQQQQRNQGGVQQQQKKGNQQLVGKSPQNKQGVQRQQQNKNLFGQKQGGQQKGSRVHYPPELIKKFSFLQVKQSMDKELHAIKEGLLKLEKSEPAKPKEDGPPVCFGCGKSGHKINACEATDKQTAKDYGRDVSATTVTHQVKLLSDMKYDLHIHDKKLYNLKCYVCNFKCNDMEQYYLHLEKNMHLKTMEKVKGKMGDPGRLELALRLSNLPSINSKAAADKDEEAYSYLCRVCLETVPGPATDHEQSRLHKYKKEHSHRCLPCRLFFPLGGVKALREHERFHLHTLMVEEDNKSQRNQKPQADQKKTPVVQTKSTEDQKKTPVDQKKTEPAKKPPAKTIKAASTETGIPAGAIIGVDFVIQVSGWFCKVCQKFYPNISKEAHCAENNHHKKLLEWCKKKNMTLETVLKTYMKSKPSASEKESSGAEGTKEDQEEEPVEVAPGSESKLDDAAMVVEKTEEEEEDVDIEGDEEGMEEGGDENMEDGGEELVEEIDDVYDDDGGHPMGDDDDEDLGDEHLGEDCDGDDDGEELEDDLILEDTSAQATSSIDESEDTTPNQSMEEEKSADGETKNEEPSSTDTGTQEVAAPAKPAENSGEQVAVKKAAGVTPSPAKRGRGARGRGRGRGKAK